ncbi:hypothetical protein [Oryzicola mucosus]|uniref:Uncharacterized protein n=1 Tax=Oryzicola mucosus TaxID=2767425 RepID=A0A8J6PTD7_9HYPH|nr:hypothetical protein [Oryzicola mucosus]MBD0413072.1 hypothetical protein [Oryzicola mucosus]
MKVTIEFYRTRAEDDAHAIVGREVTEAHDLDDAIRITRLLTLTLDMPQKPDAVAISDAFGKRIYLAVLEAGAGPEGAPPP